MILLQILTGRRASEVRTCDHDCLSPVAEPRRRQNGEVTRFRYAQSKIDIAPDTILVDREVTAVIEEQQAWLREQLPGLPAAAPVPPAHRQQARQQAVLRPAPITGSCASSATWPRSPTAGPPVRLSHTHRFRHTKLTRLAELGLPVHVLQRYAGHATPTMSMHYIAQREEHAEQAFLAAAKLQGRRHPGAVLPRGPRRHAPVRPRRPDPAQRLVPAAAPADLRQGQRVPDLRRLRHGPAPTAGPGTAARRHREHSSTGPGRLPAAPRPAHARR